MNCLIFDKTLLQKTEHMVRKFVYIDSFDNIFHEMRQTRQLENGQKTFCFPSLNVLMQ